MKRFILGWIVFGAVVGTLVGIMFLIGGGEGIIGLEGYEHGVALCESEYHTVIHLEEAHVWNDGMATYVINLFINPFSFITKYVFKARVFNHLSRYPLPWFSPIVREHDQGARIMGLFQYPKGILND